MSKSILGLSSLVFLALHLCYLSPAASAGTFLYLGTLHGLSRAVMVQQCCNLKQYTFVIIGFSLMAIVAIWT